MPSSSTHPPAEEGTAEHSASRYAARPAPRTFQEFLAMLQGDQDGGVDPGGLMVDEGLYEDIFGPNSFGATGR